MPKPTRRERRRMAEQGKLAPRRASVSIPAAPSALPRERTRADVAPSPARGAPVRSEERPALSDRQEYAYVKADLVRIMLLAGTLVAAMVALKFVLPQ